MKPTKNQTPKSKPTAPPADLLVCFPARSRLTLLPKPISSPARAPAEPNRRQLKKPAQASPLLWAKEMSSEPTSPKVTCAGQIKIRPESHRPKNWQSVMEEIERIHNKKKIPSWGIRNPNQNSNPSRNRNRNQNQNPLGFKREIVNFLSCLRGFRFDFRCFRGFPQITSDEEESESDPESEPESEPDSEPAESSRKTMFSEWFMVLQEEETKPKNDGVCSVDLQPCSVPPANALLLMRCRSAPSMGWIERKADQEHEEEEEEKGSKMSLKLLMEEEKERLVVMDYDSDFYKLSSDIAKETWVVSGTGKSNDDPLLRTRSWKR